MKTLIPVLLEELRAGRCAALATVLQSKGSAPRGAGACQLLLQEGRSVGTVGGGVLERRALLEMQQLLEQVAPTHTLPSQMPAECPSGWLSLTLSDQDCASIQEYALTQNEVQSLGMVCGGNVVLLYQVITPAMLPFFTALYARLATGGNLWLARNLSHRGVKRIALTDGQSATLPPEYAFLGQLCLRKPVWFSEHGALPSDNSNEQSWFVEPIAMQSHAYIFGGGHVAQCVAPLLAQLDFAPVVYDDRPEFANTELFPTSAGVVCAPFAEASERLAITPDDEIVIMTRGHVNDQDILTQALQTSAWYIGLIGSRSKIAHTKAMILAQGFTEADFARVKTPIGLPIQAETPMEIAVSVAAEMILCRAERAETGGTEQ